MTEEFISDIIAESNNETIESNPADDSSETNTNNPIPETDEISQPDSNLEETPEVIEQAAEPQSVETLATQLGWNADHSGPNSVDASTYILRSREIQDSMKERNDSLKGQIHNLQSSVDALREHNEMVYHADLNAKQAEIETLKKEKRAAVELADADKVDEIDSKINNIQKDLSQPKPTQAPSTNPVFDTWVADNQWYLTDNDMAQYADTVAQQYVGAPPERIYSRVRERVAEIFPEKFETPKEATPTTLANVNQTPAKPKPVGPASPVEAAKTTGNSNVFSKSDLSQDQLTIMRQFTSAGIMTEDQYIKDIAKLQG